jgi:hypothetical protein
MDDVKPGQITGRRGHGREGHFRVAPGTGGISLRGGTGWAIWRAVHAVQVGFGEMASRKQGKNHNICRGGPQVQLLIGREGFVCPARQRSTTIEDVLIHILLQWGA